MRWALWGVAGAGPDHIVFPIVVSMVVPIDVQMVVSIVVPMVVPRFAWMFVPTAVQS